MVNKEKLLQNLFNEHYQHLCFYAGKYIKDMDSVRDIVQEVFVKIWEQNINVQNPIAIKSYLYTTVSNACINYLKSTSIHNRHHDRIRQETSEADPHNYIADRIENEVMWELFSAIEGLPEECRKIFKLSYIENLDIKEVADTLNISTHTVKSQRARAKKLLQERLKDLFPLLVLIFLK